MKQPILEPCYIYLDNNATTKMHHEVLEAMIPHFSKLFGNPSSMHLCGGVVARQVREARERVADLLGAETDEIFFTSGGTESDNMAIRGALETRPGKRHIITTRVEHPGVLSTVNWLESKGCDVTHLSVDGQGRIDVEEYRAAFRPDTAIASIMWANNETGVIFPVEELAAIAAERGAAFHTDAVQAVGKIPMDLKSSAIDFLSLSGHKLHGPKGVGALYVRRGSRIAPIMFGGHQEQGRRPGTENVPSIVGLGKAAQLSLMNMDDENTRVKTLRDKLEASLLSRIPKTRVNGNVELRLPNTTNISFEFVEGEAILLRMNELRIAASSGSACTSGSLEPSHVLRAMGIPFTMIHGSIRFSLSVYNTESEIDFVTDKFPSIIRDLRDISPFWEERYARIQ
jgi:cysteine desulfurase